MICCNTYEKLFCVFFIVFVCLFQMLVLKSLHFFARLGFLVLNLGLTKDYCGILLRILDCEVRQTCLQMSLRSQHYY